LVVQRSRQVVFTNVFLDGEFCNKCKEKKNKLAEMTNRAGDPQINGVVALAPWLARPSIPATRTTTIQDTQKKMIFTFLVANKHVHGRHLNERV
jgi:hypothetical protein